LGIRHPIAAKARQEPRPTVPDANTSLTPPVPYPNTVRAM
jgi:hypothetical protein